MQEERHCNEPFIGADATEFKLAEGGIYDSEGNVHDYLAIIWFVLILENAVNLWYLMNFHFETS
jgi:hypothetical protein